MRDRENKKVIRLETITLPQQLSQFLMNTEISSELISFTKCLLRKTYNDRNSIAEVSRNVVGGTLLLIRRLSRELSTDNPQKIVNRSFLGSRIPLASLMQALAVAEHLNFRHAAASLGLSQPGVSRRIKQLEQDLGFLIFERRSRGVVITSTGRSFLDQVARAVDLLEHAIMNAGMIVGGEQGSLRVGLTTSIGAGFLAKLLAEFRQSHADIRVEHVEGQARDLIVAVRHEHLDLAFVIGDQNVEDCHSRQLWTERLVVALPQDHLLAKADGVTWRDLRGETFLVRSDGDGPQMHAHLLRRLAEWGYQPLIKSHGVQRDTLMHMIAQGDGITLAAEAAALIPIHGVIFQRILDEPEPIVFSAVWSPFNRSRPLRDLLDLALASSRETAVKD